jgi:hypothetical protein
MSAGRAKGAGSTDSPLVGAAEQFDAALRRFATLTDGLCKGPLDSQRSLERASDTLKQLAACEEEMQNHAQALMAALGTARDAQMAQTEVIRARAVEIQQRTGELAALMQRFEEVGKDAAALNMTAQALAARKRTPDEMVKDGELLAGLDELQERMTAVASGAEALAGDARATDFDDLSRKVDSLRQQLLAARNKIVLLKEALVRAAPPTRAS